MKIYNHIAALLCEDCGREQCLQIEFTNMIRGGNLFDGRSLQLCAYPRGPFDPGESDCPQHCDNCNEFLENPLTDDGRDYVREQVDNYRMNPTLRLWADYYDIKPQDEWLAELFEFELCAECGLDANQHQVTLDALGNYHATCNHGGEQ